MLRRSVVGLAVACVSWTAPSSGAETVRYKPARSDYGRVRSAWNYAGTLRASLPPDTKLVAADIELPPPKGGRFDLDDIDIFDADTGETYGSDPQIQRLTMDGDFVDNEDPELKDRADYRGIFVWVVPRRVRNINFGYWGEMLYTKPIPLAAQGRLLPEPSVTVVSRHDGGAAEKGYRRQHVVLRAAQWSRVRTPAHYRLFVAASPRERDDCDLDRWVEVSSDMAPLEVDVAARPFYLPERRFLLEFWCPKGLDPDSLTEFRLLNDPLPKTTPSTLPAAALAALASTRPLPYANHREE
jgi:hypothetical protein